MIFCVAKIDSYNNALYQFVIDADNWRDALYEAELLIDNEDEWFDEWFQYVPDDLMEAKIYYSNHGKMFSILTLDDQEESWI